MKIEWVTISSRRCLRFVFDTVLAERAALEAIEEWKREFDLSSQNKITIVWDCTIMKRYDTQARLHWQAALGEMKDQIDQIWLISTSNIVRMGASVMSVFMPFAIKAVDSEDEIILT